MSASANAPASLRVSCERCDGASFNIWADGRVFCEGCGARMGNCRAVVMLSVEGRAGAPVNGAVAHEEG
jgi:hypothetical protein